MRVNVVGLPAATPTDELATPNAFVEMESAVPLGFVFGLMFTVMDVENTWKLLTVGATANVLVEAVIVTVWVEAFVLSSLAPV